ncbi:MAG: glycosyltransferase family 9 protein [Planctomycetota bacterium]
MTATLVCYFARVGDLVMLTPVLRALAADGPLDLCARPWARDILAHEPWMRSIHVLGKPNAPFWQEFMLGSPRARLGRTLAAAGYGRIVIMDKEGPQIRRWIGDWNRGAGILELPLSRQDPTLHLIDANIAAARAAGVVVADPVPKLTVPESLRAAASTRLAAVGRRVLAIQPGTSLTHRWLRRMPNLRGLTPGQWARLLSRILADGDADGVVILGSPPERREAREIVAALPANQRARVASWHGTYNLADLPGILAGCVACISADTGPAHIASTVGTPLMVFFGPSDPGRFAARGAAPIELLIGNAPCRPCQSTPLYKRCKANVCLTGLSDAILHDAWRRLATRSAKV